MKSTSVFDGHYLGTIHTKKMQHNMSELFFNPVNI